MFEKWIDLAIAEAKTYTRASYELEVAFDNFIDYLRTLVMEQLVNAAKVAADLTPEYSTWAADPLVNRLIENLYATDSNGPIHVKISRDGTLDLFDEEFAGTFADLKAGQHAGVRRLSKDPHLRYRFWKYGIYMPIEAGMYLPADQDWFNRAVEGLPSYEEIITMRLEAWGEKAPYWYFLEYGNIGLNNAYPTFPGTRFIYKLRTQLQTEIPRVLNAFLDAWAELIVEKEFGEEPEEQQEIFWSKVFEKGGRLYQLPMVRTPQGTRIIGKAREVF